MNGTEATEAIREIEKQIGSGKHTPICAHTSYDDFECITNCQKSGMDGFITKPTDANSLKKLFLSLNITTKDITSPHFSHPQEVK